MSARIAVPAVALLLAYCPTLGGEVAPAKFTRVPTARKVAGRVRIDFAVDRETDVAVYIENARGQVACHLVAGLLGRKPPPPHPASP